MAPELAGVVLSIVSSVAGAAWYVGTRVARVEAKLDVLCGVCPRLRGHVCPVEEADEH